MQLGIVTPVFTRVPGTHSSWEADAGIEEAARIAVKADELGYHHVTCSEHIGIPTEVAKVRGSTYWDPLYAKAQDLDLAITCHIGNVNTGLFNITDNIDYWSVFGWGPISTDLAWKSS